LKVLLLDNYDSFTYNLQHYLVQFDADVDVFRNNEIEVEAIEGYDAIVLSPGPGLPNEAGILMEVIKKYAATKPILGVCLGHQALCQHFGGELLNLDTVWHGRDSDCTQIAPDDLFEGIASPFKVGHYHSWSVRKDNIGIGLIQTAESEHGWVMAMQHESLPIHGVQFHPESVMTPDGLKMISNWVDSLK